MISSKTFRRSFQLTKHLKEAVVSRLPGPASSLPLESVLVTQPPPKFAEWDYQTNAAFLAAKQLKQKPIEVAKSLEAVLAASAGPIKASQVSGAGFLLLQLDNCWLLQAAVSGGGLLSEREEGSGAAPVCIDFAGPNAGKDLHAGHLRSAAIGDTLSRLYSFLGVPVARQSHVGDIGLAIATVVQYVIEANEGGMTGNTRSLGQLYAEARERSRVDVGFAERCQQVLIHLQHRLRTASSNATTTATTAAAADGDRPLALWQDLCRQSQDMSHSLWHALGVEVDDAPESSYLGVVEDVLQELLQRGIATTLEDGAVVVRKDIAQGEQEEALHVLKRSSGTYLYAAIDLAALYQRLKAGYGTILYVTDQAQSLHFQSVFEIARQAGWVKDGQAVEHVGFGVVQGQNGKKLSSRAGVDLSLQGLLEAGVEEYQRLYSEREDHRIVEGLEDHLRLLATSAIRYYELSHSRSKPYQFSFASAFSSTGNTAISLSYVMSRLNSLYHKAVEKGYWEEAAAALSPGGLQEAQGSAWTALRQAVLSRHDTIELLQGMAAQLSSAERSVLLASVGTTDAIADSLRLRSPHILSEHSYALAKAFHSFYDSEPILKADIAVEDRSRRLLICAILHDTLATCLSLLGIRTAKQL